MRGDDIACYETDLGPAADFWNVTPLAIYSEGDDSVAECMDAGDRNRHDFYWNKRLQEMQAESTLMKDIVEQRDMISKVIRNQTVSGPHQTTQRNGYSHVTTERNMLDRKHRVSGRTQF